MLQSLTPGSDDNTLALPLYYHPMRSRNERLAHCILIFFHDRSVKYMSVSSSWLLQSHTSLYYKLAGYLKAWISNRSMDIGWDAFFWLSKEVTCNLVRC